MQMLLNIASASPPWPEDLGEFRNIHSGGRSSENANSSKQQVELMGNEEFSQYDFFPTDLAFTREHLVRIGILAIWEALPSGQRKQWSTLPQQSQVPFPPIDNMDWPDTRVCQSRRGTKANCSVTNRPLHFPSPPLSSRGGAALQCRVGMVKSLTEVGKLWVHKVCKLRNNPERVWSQNEFAVLHYYTTDSIRIHGSSYSQDGGVILQVFSQSCLPAGTTPDRTQLVLSINVSVVVSPPSPPTLLLVRKS